ncbi:MAG: ribose-phosphate pyrophosphokinase [Gammaproteobacteria bacterium]|nr:ribose-phosphate pyrophosphokinase [Gammaproteobacteria bacterium]
MLLFVPGESRGLGGAIAAAAGAEPAPLEERRFERGEFKLRPLVSVRDRDVVVIQTLSAGADAPIADRFVRLLFLLMGLRDAGARRCSACVPYLAFARKDRRTQTRDPVHTRYVAELLEAAGLHRLLALDVHNPAALDNAFRVPVDHLSALPMFADHFARQLAGAPLAVVSPDVGGIKRAQLFREQLAARSRAEVTLAFVEKRRAAGIVTSGVLAGDVAGRSVIVIDDLCASGGTLVRAARACRAAGAEAVFAAATHAPLSEGLDVLAAEPALTGSVITDSVGEDFTARVAVAGSRLQVLSVAPLLGAALSRMRERRPLAPLLLQWPPAD